MTHIQHHAVLVVSLLMKTVLFLTENGYQEASIDCRGGRGGVFVCKAVLSHAPASFSGADVQEREEDCLTEATTPTSHEPIGQSQMSTVALDESAPEEVSPVDEDTSPAEEVSAPKEEVKPAEAEPAVAQPQEDRDSEKEEKPEEDTDSSSQSVDELLADWREDLEAFKQMEKDEL